LDLPFRKGQDPIISGEPRIIQIGRGTWDKRAKRRGIKKDGERLASL